VEVVKWYGADRFCLFLGGKSNESETCGLGLELDLTLRPVDLNLDLEKEKEDLGLGLDYISAASYTTLSTSRA